MKKKEPEIKVKEFQLSELELTKLELNEVKARQANAYFAQQGEMIIDEFCKRIGQKRENLIMLPDGRIPIEKGKVKFKE